MKILITGAAGFIGFHCTKLLKNQYNVIGLDNINDYYDVNLKYARLNELGVNKNNIQYNKIIKSDNFSFIKLDLNDYENLKKLFENEKFDYVIHLAAQAGIRYSIQNPRCYISSNIDGFFNILECCKEFNIQKTIYASSSSVYGNTDKIPFSENTNINSPESLYAVTKISNELLAHIYNKMYSSSLLGLRFFTVYGPYGRPDMAPFIFTKSILNNQQINVFNYGNLYRDFTYIDDIVNAIKKLLDYNFINKHEIFNIGKGSPIKLLDFIETIEEEIGIKANKNLCEMQKGDVYTTFANTTKLKSAIGYEPVIDIKEGVHNFIKWYKQFYKID